MERLFVYGTLMDAAVQKAVTGRRLAGRRGRLHGYRLSTLRQGGKVYPMIVEEPGEAIDGLVLKVSPGDLELLDDYEGRDYRRTRVVLEGGEECWAYVGVTYTPPRHK